jgi:hypothetical protein
MHTTPEMSVPELVMNCLAPSMTHSPSCRRARVRAGLGLGQPEGAEDLARAQARQPLLLLRRGAEQVDRLRAQRGVGAQGDGDARVNPGELLDGDGVLKARASGAADLFGEGDAHPAQRGHLGHDVVGEGVVAVELLRGGRHLGLRELTDGALQQFGLIVEREVHAGEVGL